MLDAARYYEDQATDLGREFLQKLDSAFADLAANPERWPVVGHEIRRRLISRFPYAVLYRLESAEVVVVAIAHLRRRPDYGMER